MSEMEGVVRKKGIGEERDESGRSERDGDGAPSLAPSS